MRGALRSSAGFGMLQKGLSFMVDSLIRLRSAVFTAKCFEREVSARVNYVHPLRHSGVTVECIVIFRGLTAEVAKR